MRTLCLALLLALGCSDTPSAADGTCGTSPRGTTWDTRSGVAHTCALICGTSETPRPDLYLCDTDGGVGNCVEFGSVNACGDCGRRCTCATGFPQCRFSRCTCSLTP